MDRDWKRLGMALQAARTEHLGLPQDELAAELATSRSTVQAIERGDSRKKPSQTIRAYARRVGWTDDSVDRVLAGGDPAFRTSQASAEPARAADIPAVAADAGLPLRIADELAEGSLLDTAVIPLGGDARMVVVVKGTPGATPEEIRRGLEAWRRAQPQLQELDETTDAESSKTAEM
ncbi:helix-turn-helix domain-containing protein [Streptomyces odontomachi]|uniref:helix-turn-helix domain-containing protein n=1 Tax=Streptomyces odontomachi TaxID=2944940 RepID=UPI00210AE1AC|nr:helix-turn-helix domain-containing protein [Streptomyces sp. ODS25]